MRLAAQIPTMKLLLRLVGAAVHSYGGAISCTHAHAEDKRYYAGVTTGASNAAQGLPQSRGFERCHLGTAVLVDDQPPRRFHCDRR
ncbi:hypothetical protein D3872_13410 [Massilia cavernae]|uniref:Uncharacterized protein n=1 Tax=Massilia cavernae TaxID=2320864 RepID=A0A418XS40_9BURK|nr:hypothetical protein D3872_13410 [Massilia cavernae]